MNQLILEEANSQSLWRRARKTRPIWARRLDRQEIIQTLEGPEDVPAGAYLCRGEAGDIWPQSEQSLFAKYAPDVVEGAWQRFMPRSDKAGVLAARIEHSFDVQARWGRLAGKAGDYLIKAEADRDSPLPDDIWIVDQSLFQSTYEFVDAKEGGGSESGKQ